MITTTIIVSGIVFGMLGFFAGPLCRGAKRADENVKGPSQYERLGTIHSGLDPLEDRMLRQLTRRHGDLLDLKKRWLDPA